LGCPTSHATGQKEEDFTDKSGLTLCKTNYDRKNNKKHFGESLNH